LNKNLRSAALIAVALSTAAPSLRAATVVNRSIATVNGEAILLSEFEKNWESFREQQKSFLPPEQMTPEWEQETKKKIVDQMVDDKILLQEAKKRKVRVNQRELENGVIQVRARFLPEAGRRELEALVQRAMASRPPEEQASELTGVDLPSLWQELTKNNPKAVQEADEKFKQELAKEGMTEKKFQDRIRDQLSVVSLTQQEVRARTQPPKDEEGRKLFQQVQAVMAGKKPQGLDPESLADAESLARFFSAQTGERVRARHILVQVPKDASFKDKSAARRKIDDARAKLVAGADFGELAEKTSDDKASAVRGGDLGAFTPGQMVPAFDKAAFSLPVGQISDVIETDFGYHVIRVDEKRAATKLRYEDVQDELKEYLYRVNAQEIFEGYVKELRGAATVKTLIDVTQPAAK
jgi:parvulin-like peptidyl-prolyl isomerase